MIYNIRQRIISEPFPELHKRKNEILSLIDNAPDKEIESYDYGQTSDHQSNITVSPISKLDWFQATNFERAWVKIVKPMLMGRLGTMVERLGYRGINMHEIWFQQYKINSSHDWHIHSYNYSGAYYLELPDTGEHNTTELFDGEKVISPNCKEGDLLIFPSLTFHRAPKITTHNRKTIISFNFDIRGIQGQHYDNLKLYNPMRIDTKDWNDTTTQ